MSYWKFEGLLTVALVSVLFTGIVMASTPQINVLSPTDGESISGTLEVAAEVSDSGDDLNSSSLTYKIKNSDGDPAGTGSYNDSVDVSSYPDGDYSVTFYANDSSGNFVSKQVGFTIGSSSDDSDDSGSLIVDDRKESTSIKDSQGNSIYGINIGFIGSDLSVVGGTSSNLFNLTTLNGSLKSEVSGDQNFTTNDTFSEGRYLSYNKTSNSSTKIDLVKNSSDVTGRINSSSNFSIGSVDISIYSWLESDEIDVSTTDSYNTSVVEDWNGSTEALYRFNTSKDKYWIGIKSTGKAETVKASEGAPRQVFENLTASIEQGPETPRINDFQLENGSTASGYVKNTTGSALSQIEVKIKSMSCSGPRTPYLTCPPVRTDVTDSNGKFSFSQLPTSRYKLLITNSSYSRDESQGFGSDFEIVDSNTSKTVPNLTATDSVGNLSGSLTKTAGNRYGMLAQNFTMNRTFLETGLDSNFNVTLPSGSYNVIVAKFGSSSPEDISIKSLGQVEVNSGQNTEEFSIEFPEKVYFNGTVNKSSGGSVSDARLILQNESSRKFATGMTDSDGNFSIKVDKGQSYNLRIQPSFSSNLVSKSGINVEMNSSTLSQSNNYTLSQGAILSGNVTDQNGNAVKNAYVDVSNYSESTYASTTTNASGEYKVKGLKTGSSYAVDIYPRDFGVSEIHTNVEINQSSETKNFSVTEQTTSFTVDVENSTGSSIDSDILVESEDSAFSSRKSTSGGSVTFSNLNQNQYYRVSIEPDSTSYERKRDFIIISDSSESITYTVEKITGLSGYVEKSSGGTVSGAYVQAINRSIRSYASAQTDSDGFYNLEVPDKGHEITVYPPFDSDLQSSSKTVSKSDISSQQNITLSTGYTLNVNITASGITPKGTISVWNSSENSYGYKSFSSGSFKIKGLKNISHDVWINLENDKYGTKNTEINSSAFTNNATFQYGKKKGRKLRITVTGNNGGIANATVATRRTEKLTDRNGTAVLPKQKKNKNVSVFLNAEGYKGEIQDVETNSSKVGNGSLSETYTYQNVTFSLESIQQVLDVRVNVTDPNDGDSAVTDASVVFTSNESGVSQSSSGVTGSNGKTTLNDLAGGNYLVTLALGEGSVYRNTTSISLDDTGTLSLDGGNYDLWYEVNEG